MLCVGTAFAFIMFGEVCLRLLARNQKSERERQEEDGGERHKDIKSDSELPQMVFITHNFMFACLLELLLRDGFHVYSLCFPRLQLR